MEIKYAKHNSGRNDSFGDGVEFQDFVCDLLAKKINLIIQNYSSKYFQWNHGENRQGMEIKLDNRCTDTKRLSIEIAEKANGDNLNFVPSGIYRDDNSYLYIVGNRTLIYIFAINFLQRLHKTGKYIEATHPPEKPTIKKFYLPFEEADKYCIKKILVGE